MSLPTQTDIINGGYCFGGETFADAEAKVINTIDNGYFFNGEQFVAATDSNRNALRTYVINT